jgi:hypothetical protein
VLVHDALQLQLLLLLALDGGLGEPRELGDGLAEVIVAAELLELLAVQDLVEGGLLLLYLGLLPLEEDVEGSVAVGDSHLGGTHRTHYLLRLLREVLLLLRLQPVGAALLQVLALHWNGDRLRYYINQYYL